MRTVLHQIWATLYVEYVVKSPLSPIEHPKGVGVANELFEGGLETFMVSRVISFGNSRSRGHSAQQKPNTTTSTKLVDHNDKTQGGSDVFKSALTTTAQRVLPTLLVDVESRTLVETPRGAKYLALIYCWADRNDPMSKQADMASSIVDLDQETLIHIPSSFAKAMDLTKDMGYRHLWIDTLCEPIGPGDRRLAPYYQATLTILIVSVSSNPSPDHIWHIACDYRKLPDILSWGAGNAPEIFQHVQNLGHGSYGIVDEVKLRSTQQLFARKMLLSWRNAKSRGPTQLQEIEMLQKFRHPNIPSFVAAYFQKHSLNILMQPVAQCDLRQFLTHPDRWAENRPYIPRWFHALASALEHMHDLSCRHKDIKPANILISKNQVFLTDFGTARDFQVDKSESCGGALMTPKYCSPEVARHGPRGRKSDIFSLGCVFIELLTVALNIPLSELEAHMLGNPSSQPGLEYHKNLPALKTWRRRLRLQIDLPYQTTVLKLCKKMLHHDPVHRPSARDLCSNLERLPRTAFMLPSGTREIILRDIRRFQRATVLSSRQQARQLSITEVASDSEVVLAPSFRASAAPLEYAPTPSATGSRECSFQFIADSIRDFLCADAPLDRSMNDRSPMLSESRFGSQRSHKSFFTCWVIMLDVQKVVFSTEDMAQGQSCSAGTSSESRSLVVIYRGELKYFALRISAYSRSGAYSGRLKSKPAIVYTPSAQCQGPTLIAGHSHGEQCAISRIDYGRVNTSEYKSNVNSIGTGSDSALSTFSSNYTTILAVDADFRESGRSGPPQETIATFYTLSTRTERQCTRNVDFSLGHRTENVQGDFMKHLEPPIRTGNDRWTTDTEYETADNGHSGGESQTPRHRRSRHCMKALQIWQLSAKQSIISRAQQLWS